MLSWTRRISWPELEDPGYGEAASHLPGLGPLQHPPSLRLGGRGYLSKVLRDSPEWFSGRGGWKSQWRVRCLPFSLRAGNLEHQRGLGLYLKTHRKSGQRAPPGTQVKRQMGVLLIKWTALPRELLLRAGVLSPGLGLCEG